jgi:hypothetical protein
MVGGESRIFGKRPADPTEDAIANQLSDAQKKAIASCGQEAVEGLHVISDGL